MQAGAPRLEIVQAEDRHADMLAEFIRSVWDPDASAASVLRARAHEGAHNVAEPGVPPPTWIAIRDGKVIGYVTTIPIRLWNGVADQAAYWIKGLMVLPEFRGGPVGYLVLKAASTSLRLSGGLAVAEPARRLFEALGYRDLGAVPNWIRPVAPHRIVQRLDFDRVGLHPPAWAEPILRLGRRNSIVAVLAWAGGALLRFTAGVARLSATGLEAGILDPRTVAGEIDALWANVGKEQRSAVVRNAQYLLHRYPADSSEYIWLGARRGGVLVGIAVLRQPSNNGDDRLKGIKVATVADMLYAPSQPSHALALLGAAEHAGRGVRADALLVSTSSPALARLLKRQWYLPIAGNVHLLMRDAAEPSSFGALLNEWWITRGDGQADEAF